MGRVGHQIQNTDPKYYQLRKKFILQLNPKLTKLIKLIEKDFPKYVDDLPAPFGDEIRGVAQASEMPLADVFLYNIFYEIFTLCTSIVGQDDHGKIYHARNLDFGLFVGWDIKNDTWLLSEYLRPLIVNLNFSQGGEVQYRATSFLGFVGLITGVKPGHFSFSMNERFATNGGYVGLFEWFLNIDRQQAFGVLLARQVFETPGMTFDKMVGEFEQTPLLSPAYFILAGTKPGQGVVVTRERKESLKPNWLGDHGQWYLVQTNYDHWENTLFLDDRRHPAMHCLNVTTQPELAFDSLFDVLSSRPVLNKLTTYSALIEPKSGKLEAYIQFCESPCQPF